MAEAEQGTVTGTDESFGAARSAAVAEVAANADRRYRRWLVTTAVLGAVVVPLAMVVVFSAAEGSSDDEPWWVWALILGVFALPVLVVVAVFAWFRRRGARWSTPALAFGVDRKRRKRILTAIRKGEAVDESDQAIAQDLAERLQMQRWLVYSQPVLVVILALPRILGDGPLALDLWMYACCLLILVSLPFTLRDVRRGRAWLAEHGNR